MIEGLAARRAALESLLDFSEQGLFVAESLGRHCQGLLPRDRALAMESALATVRWKARLDHHLDRFLRGTTPEPLRWLLRLGLAQCHILDRIPPHAAVHLSVEMAHDGFGRGAPGLVNAVLRRAVYTPWDDPQGDDAPSLAVRYSHPEWLVARWLKRHGPETTRSMLEAGSTDPEVWVRVRPGAPILPWDPPAETARLHEGFFRRLDTSRERILGSDAFRDGFVSFQDPSSGLAALSLSGFLRPGMVLADLCAAPGGKLACLHDHGDLEGVRCLAMDLSSTRQRRTQDGFRRLGVSGLVAVADGTRPPVREGSLDAILLDAPCSNLGVLSRRPEARWRLRPDDPRRHGKLQRALVENALPCLRQGGLLAYSVCSTEPEEGLQVVESLPGCRIESAETRLPGGQDGDGFFLALLRRT
jgi:16S rRNA (cytosine967-C5)-methyltransferase